MLHFGECGEPHLGYPEDIPRLENVVLLPFQRKM